MSEVAVKGLADLQRALDTLPARIERNIMRGALRAGAKVIEAEAKRLAPVGPPGAENARLYGGRVGLLRDSIRVSVNAKRGTITARVVAGGKVKGGGDAYYARFVEFGTAAHAIRAPIGGALTIDGRSYRVVNHPGASAQPFLRPAMDGQAQSAIEAAREYIRTRLREKHGLDVPGPDNQADSEVPEVA